MDIAVCVPTCNELRANRTTRLWNAAGYSVCLWVEPKLAHIKADLVHVASEYPGWFVACNKLAAMAVDNGADVVVLCGDDIDPDPRHTAKEAAAIYMARFPNKLGLMQPTGDSPTNAGEWCGSPWLGSAWVQRAYMGHGSTWPGYYHFWGDWELECVAKRLELLWKTSQLSQYHHHPAVGRAPRQTYQALHEGSWFDRDHKLFSQRKANNFPGSGLRL